MLNLTPCILLVDDDPDNLFFLEELLRSEGYATLKATSGPKALAVAAQSTPDLILLDVMMPYMDGFEVCRLLREDQKLQTVPVVFLTALDSEESRLQGLEMMGDDYLTKPISSKLLLAKIASVLRLSAMRSQQSQTEISQQVKEQSRQQIAAAWEVNDYISEKFRLFVPEQYLERIAPQGVESIRLGNAREEELTVLFCDIRGFSAIAENQRARETFAWLNAFFTQMSQAITAHHGFVDKFLGDAIFAVFDRVNTHPTDAVDAAIAMQLNLNAFNRDRHQYNLDLPINVGIGIHTGLGMIGTVGSNQRMDSTVLGDVVNTAARLEELTKLYGCPILTSDTTMSHITASSAEANPAEPQTSYSSRWIDRVTPRGKRIVLELYEILGTPAQPLAQAKLRDLPLYNAALEAWWQEDFVLALSAFEQVVAQNPADRTAQIYRERCQVRLGRSPQPTGNSWNSLFAG